MKQANAIAGFVGREKPMLLALLTALIAKLILDDPNMGPVGSYGSLTLVVLVVTFAVMIYASMAVVGHAEVLAHRLGEPAGTLVLTLTAAGVEVIMMTAIALTGKPDPHIVKDTVYSTVMILLTGLLGGALLLGGLRHGEQQFNFKSSKSYQSVLLGMLGISLFLPTVAGGAVVRTIHWFLVSAFLLLYGIFLKLQVGKHNLFFRDPVEHPHAPVASGHSTAYHVVVLLLTVVSISVVAEFFATGLDEETERHHLPVAIKGLIVAVLMAGPEGLTAIRAARQNEMQRVMNIVLGSALSTVSLTVPAMLIVGQIKGLDFNFVLAPFQVTLLAVSLGVVHISETEGKTNILDGAVQLILFAGFVFFALTVH